MKQLKLVIKGDVQGVSFRGFVRKFAAMLNLTGFVQNIEEDKVLVVAQGKEKDLRTLKTFCEKGPTFAKIKKIEEEWGEATEKLEGFEVRY
ncbi:acylphosphatase [Candidatus Woesearchaeota archaeon]|nr:acylphosphatase [Candidatus Woesearchaeota archaeon]